MKVILIDSTNHTVTEAESTGLETLQELVGGLIAPTYRFEGEDGSETDTVFVNEEGLNHGEENFFFLKGAHQPFAGNGVVVGFDPEEGSHKDTTQSLSEIKERVTFHTRQEVQRFPGRFLPDPEIWDV